MILRLKPEMAADLDPGGVKRLQDRKMRALEFNDVGAGRDKFLRVRDGGGWRIIGLKRQVADDRRPGRAAPRGGDMVAHVGEGHLALAGDSRACWRRRCRRRE